MKPLLMIHEFKEEFLDLPLEKYILTFDDGLYTQFKFIKELQKINTDKYFFISSNIVCPENIKQDKSFIECSQAHRKAFKGNFENYMKWSQIKIIDNLKKFKIGCHSHFHSLKTANCVECIILDNKLMLKEFKEKLGYIPEIFCYPYNHKSQLYEEILFKKGFTKFYGEERIDIYNL